MLLSTYIMQENENPIFGLPNGTLYMWIFRYIYFVVFLFTSFYLLFFMGTGTETKMFLTKYVYNYYENSYIITITSKL